MDSKNDNNKKWVHVVLDSEFFEELEKERKKIKEPNRAAFYRLLLRLGLNVLRKEGVGNG